VILTPGTGTTLTGPAGASIQNNETAINAAKILTLAGAAATITDGTLRVAPDATFAIDGVVLTTNIPVPAALQQIGYLAVSDGGSLRLAATGGVGSVFTGTGNTTITALAAATLKAGGGTVTLGNNKIAGNVTGAVLTAATGAPSFTLDGQTGLLSLEQVDLNLAANGSVVIDDAEGRVILTGQAKIILNNGEGGVSTARSRITNGGNVGVLSGGVVGLTAPTATTTQPVWSVAHRDAAAADVSIVAAAAGFTLSKTGTSFTN
jgi:hypothetical protein